MGILLLVPEKISGRLLPGSSAHSLTQENLLLSAMDVLFYIRLVYFQHLFFFLVMTDLICKHLVIKKTTAADCFLYLDNLFFIWIDPYFYCPVYLSHPDFLYTDELFLLIPVCTEQTKTLTPKCFFPQFLFYLWIFFFQQPAAGAFIRIDKLTEF